MQRLYCALSGLNKDTPESLLSETPKLYDYDDVHTWLPKVMNKLVHAEVSSSVLSDLIHHLQDGWNFTSGRFTSFANVAFKVL